MFVKKNPFIRLFTESGEAAGGGAAEAPKPSGEEPLGESGIKALQEEREARKNAEDALKAVRDGMTVFREREARTKAESDLAEALTRIKELEEAAEASERERGEQIAAAEKSAAEKVLRYEIAAEKGLPLSAASRLRGETKEEVEADADELIKLLGDQQISAMVPDPSQGARGPHLPDAEPGVPRLAQAFNSRFTSK